jgi:hypothetical protein
VANVISQLKVILGIETKGFSQARVAAQSVTESIQRNFARMSTAVAGYFTFSAGKELVRSVAQLADHIQDASERMGVGTDEVQRFEKAFKSVGGTIDDAAAAMDLLIDKRKQALEEGGDAAKQFRNLGIGEDELRGLTSGGALFRRAARAGNDPTNIGQREAFIDMFGAKRGGKALAAAAALESGEGDKGSIMSEADIKMLAESMKAFERGVLDFKIAAAPLAAELARFGGAILKHISGKGDGSMSQTIDALANGSQAGMLFKFGAKALEWATRDRSHVNEIIPPLARQGAAAMRQLQGQDGKPVYDIMGGGWSQIPGPVGSTPAKPGQFGADRDRERKAYQDALDSSLFKASNTSERKRMLDAQMERDAAEARRLRAAGKDTEALKLETGIIKTASERAELERTDPFRISADSLAQVGGYVGGAAAGIDPSIQIQQDMRSILANILTNIQNLPPNMQTAIANATRQQPIDATGGIR